MPIVTISRDNVTVTLKWCPFSVRNPHPTPMSRLPIDLTTEEFSPVSTPVAVSPTQCTSVEQTIAVDISYCPSRKTGIDRVLIVSNIDSTAHELTAENGLYRGKVSLSMREIGTFAYAFVLVSNEEKAMTEVFTVKFDVAELVTTGVVAAERRHWSKATVRGSWKTAVSISCRDSQL